MPDVTADVRSQLLLHQLLVGLPTAVSKQLRANGDVNDLEKTIERARLLLSLEEERPTAVATVSAALSEVELKLRKQVDELAEQVAALRGEKSLPSSLRHLLPLQSARTREAKLSRSEKQTTSVKKLFYLWACRTYSQKLSPGKLQWGVRSRSERRTFQSPVAPFDVTMVTTTKSKLATCILKGELCGVQVNIYHA